MTDWVQVVALALIQGITEFLPVSSSGHLVLLPNLTSLPDQGQTLDVAAHAGTMIAVMVYLRRDIAEMGAGLSVLPKHELIRQLAHDIWWAFLFLPVCR